MFEITLKRFTRMKDAYSTKQCHMILLLGVILITLVWQLYNWTSCRRCYCPSNLAPDTI